MKTVTRMGNFEIIGFEYNGIGVYEARHRDYKLSAYKDYTKTFDDFNSAREYIEFEIDRLKEYAE